MFGSSWVWWSPTFTTGVGLKIGEVSVSAGDASVMSAPNGGRGSSMLSLGAVGGG